jgi:hypothetical protein
MEGIHAMPKAAMPISVRIIMYVCKPMILESITSRIMPLQPFNNYPNWMKID